MKMLVSTVVIVGVFVAAPLAAVAQDKEELKKFEGTWALKKGEEEGKKLSKKIRKNSLLVIKGNKHIVTVGDKKIVGTHKVDPTKKPKAIDAMDTEGPFAGKTVLGIYKIKGNKLTVCFAPPGKDRPTEFTTQSGTGVIYHVWVRKKE